MFDHLTPRSWAFTSWLRGVSRERWMVEHGVEAGRRKFLIESLGRGVLGGLAILLVTLPAPAALRPLTILPVAAIVGLWATMPLRLAWAHLAGWIRGRAHMAQDVPSVDPEVEGWVEAHLLADTMRVLDVPQVRRPITDMDDPTQG